MSKKIFICLALGLLLLLFTLRKPLYSSLVFSETSVETGCLDEFCVGETRSNIYDHFVETGKFDVGYNDGISVKITSKELFLKLENKNFESLSLFKKGKLLNKYVTHIKFKQDIIVEVTREYYGPLYFDL